MILDDKGTPGDLVLTPRGCYRGTMAEGGRLVPWREKGFPFDVECFFYEDYDANGFVYQTKDGVGEYKDPTHIRASVLFGYSPETGWVYLGYIRDKKFISDIEEWEKQHNGLSVTQDEQHYAQMWNIPLWNVNWVQEAWEMSIKPLPQDWQTGLSENEVVRSVTERLNYWQSWIAENAAYRVSP